MLMPSQHGGRLQGKCLDMYHERHFLGIALEIILDVFYANFVPS